MSDSDFYTFTEKYLNLNSNIINHNDLSISLKDDLRKLLNNKSTGELLRFYEIYSKLIEKYLGNKIAKKIEESAYFANTFYSSFNNPSEEIYQFISDLYEDKSNFQVLDPYLTITSPSYLLFNQNVYGECLGNQYDILNEICSFSDRIISTDTDNIKSNWNLKFDLILTTPPFRKKINQSSDVNIFQESIVSILSESKNLLSEKGEILLIVPNSFFNNSRIRGEIIKTGNYVKAIFALSSRFSYFSARQMNLVLLSKEIISQVFVAQITSEISTNKIIVQNFKNNKSGKILELGSYTAYDNFLSFESYVANKEFNDKIKKTGIELLSFRKIIKSIDRIKQTFEFDSDKALLFIPIIGSRKVTSDFNKLPEKPFNYLYIEFDDNFIDIKYAELFLNSELGVKYLNSLRSGINNVLTKVDLLNSFFPVPKLDYQLQVLKVDNKINSLQLDLEKYRKTIWDNPLKINSVKAELKSVYNEDKMAQWIDELPFPISSILWRYYATKDNRKKIDHLFHFFEAFSEFTSMIILSSFISDLQFFKSECSKVLKSDEKHQKWHLKTSFGNWNVLLSNLSKTIRVFLQDVDQKDYIKKIFGDPIDDFMKMLSNKELVKILEKTCTWRNEWKGHGGVLSDSVLRQRIETLESSLNHLRQIIGFGFSDFKIISPSTCEYSDGLFSYKTKELVGARTPFNERITETLIPLDTKKLYFLHFENKKPIELIPFIKYVEERDAIYFYSSVESKDVRWVSYHFENEADLRVPIEDGLLKIFEYFELAKNG